VVKQGPTRKPASAPQYLCYGAPRSATLEKAVGVRHLLAANWKRNPVRARFWTRVFDLKCEIRRRALPKALAASWNWYVDAQHEVDK
jgi:hypothetical protein